MKTNNLIDRRFGSLTVIGYSGIHKTPCGTRRKLWKCICDCGTEKNVQENNLLNGSTNSCGCMKKIRIAKRNTKHGGARQGSEERLYNIWRSMKRRCNSPNDSHFNVYGAKGVRVCEEWGSDYSSFREWAYKNGYDENAPFGECTLDRINNNGNYDPENCRWVNRTAQANNTSRNHYVELNGCRMTIAEFARTMNISKNQARYYIDKFEKEVKHGTLNLASGGD